jgi:hypothetical protein
VRDADVVEAHLRRLDDERLLALVADVWAERGYDTSRTDGVVVAERDGHRTTLAVAGRGSEATRVLDAGDVRELLWYAVEPHVRVDLCRRHLGAPPSALGLPAEVRIRRRLRTLRPVASLLVVVLAAAVLVAVVGGTSLAPSLTGAESTASGGTDRPERSTTATPAAVDGAGDAGAYRPDEDVDGIPGANRSGITDVATLAAAHEDALADRSYAVWIDESRPETWEEGAPRVHSDVDVTVEGSRYRVVATDTVGRTPRSERVQRIYYDGSSRYVAEETATGTTYRTVGANESRAVEHDPFVFRDTVVRRYLSTPETRYEGYIDQEGDLVYRFEGEGTPEGLNRLNVSDYRFFVVVDDSGLVLLGNAKYTLTVGDRTAEVRFRWTYGGFGETTVSAPSWYRAEFVNETRTPAD